MIRQVFVLMRLLGFVWCFTAQAQTIISAEYYLDEEPGVGNGQPIAVAAGDSVEFTFDLPYTDLSEGFHYVYVRIKNDLSQWSMVEHRAFMVQTVPLLEETIVDAEYFVDEDPGVGNAMPLAVVGQSDSVEFVFDVDLNDIGPGFHYLFIRVKNAQGFWGMLAHRVFYVVPVGTVGQDIVAGEYFVDTEPGVGLGTPFTIPSVSDSVETDLSFALPELENGPHVLYIRLLSSGGNWSMIEPRPFTICETYGAVAQFSFTEEGNTVFFDGSPMYADSLQWNFGDGFTSELEDPVHVYTDAGVYEVSMHAYNGCAFDTLTEQVIIGGLESVSPTSFSNSAVSSFHLFGFGFVDGTSVLLTRDEQTITPFSVSVESLTTLSCLADFSGSEAGLWSVEVSIPGEGTFVLPDAIELVSSVFSTANVSMVSASPSVIRTARRAPITMFIANDNLSDAIALPVLYRDISDVSHTCFANLAPITENDYFAATYQYLLDNGIGNTLMEYGFVDAETNSKFASFMIPRVPAQDILSLPMYVQRMVSGTHQHGAGMLFPQLSSGSLMGAPEIIGDFCWSSFVRLAAEDVLGFGFDEEEWNSCFASVELNMYSAIAELAADASLAGRPVPMGACITGMLVELSETGCVAGLNIETEEQFRAIVSHVLSNMAFLNDGESLALACPQLQGMVLSPQDHAGPDRDNEFCDLVMGFGPPTLFSSAGGQARALCMTNSNSVDPNEKYGPGDNTDHVFVDPGELAAYTITFENDSAATAPVEFMEIRDTLLAGMFDVSSFRWGSVLLSDSILIVPDADDHHQILLTDLRPELPYYLYAELTFEPEVPLVKWYFEVRDTVNIQPFESGLEGFLPPNVNGTSGAGDVNFVIRYADDLVTGDEIPNDAEIVFDFNAPIITPEWYNVVDNTAPVSEVNDLPETTTETEFEVSWSGEDAPAGISYYVIYLSENDGPFLPWISSTTSTSALFNGEVGSTYKYYSLAVDRAGNVEESPADPWSDPDAVITLVTSVAELPGGLGAAVFPNPAESSVNCRFSSISDRIVKIEWYTGTGERIQLTGQPDTLQLKSGTTEFNWAINQLASGVYILRFISDDGTGSIRLVVH